MILAGSKSDAAAQDKKTYLSLSLISLSPDVHCSSAYIASPHVIFSESRTRTGEVMIVQSAGPQRWRHFRPMEDRLLLSLGACSRCGIGPLL